MLTRPDSSLGYEGWAKRYGDELWHYFEQCESQWGSGLDTNSLCGLYRVAISVTQLIPDYIGEPQPDDCAACRTKLDQRSAEKKEDPENAQKEEVAPV